ncbi:TPA: hypothetical protein ACH3X3_005026 [Trebouxia sp. C0006]
MNEKPEAGTSDNTKYLMLTPQKLIIGSKQELLATVKKVDLTDFAPRHMPELRIALLNIAFTQNPALKATLQRQATNHFPSSQVTKLSLQRSPQPSVPHLPRRSSHA